MGKVTVVALVVTGLTVGGVGIHAAAGPHRSTKSFCQVYSTEKAKFIHETNGNDLASGLSAVIGMPQMFDRLDKVAPDEIEPDVANIRDALKKSEDAAGGALGNPLGALGQSLVAGIEAGPSWERVANFVDQNCPKTPAEQAAIEEQRQKDQLDQARSDFSTAIAAAYYDTLNLDEGDKPFGLMQDFEADLQTMRDAVKQYQQYAVEDITTPSDCDGFRSVLKDDYDLLYASLKDKSTSEWPPTLDDDKTPEHIRQDVSKAQQAMEKLQSLGGDPNEAKPGLEPAPEQTIADAQDAANRIEAELADAQNVHTPDWYLQQLKDIYENAHLGGRC
jgi:hypothetical protein